MFEYERVLIMEVDHGGGGSGLLGPPPPWIRPWFVVRSHSQTVNTTY